MKRHLRISYIGLASFALLLGACAKEDLNIGSRSAFQIKAEKSLRNITAKVTGLKAVRGTAGGNFSGGIQDISMYYSNPYQNFQPYNNVFLRNDMHDELAECKEYISQLPRTAAYYRPRIILAFQCGMAAVQSRDPMMTALYRNSTGPAQDMWEYDAFWRFPQSYGSYQNLANTGYNQYSGQYGGQPGGFQFLNQYMGQGYIPQTITYR